MESRRRPFRCRRRQDNFPLLRRDELRLAKVDAVREAGGLHEMLAASCRTRKHLNICDSEDEGPIRLDHPNLLHA